MHVLTRPGQSIYTNRLAQDLCNMFPQMLPVLREDMLAALGLARLEEAQGWHAIEHRQLGSDSYHAYERIRTGD